MSEAVVQTITPVTHDLGAFKVRRTLPARERTMVGPFIFVDQFGPARLPPGQGMDVRPHPHINLATVTYLFDGAIEHRDSIGSHAVIEPGAINLMTAGSGIVHSERSPASAAAGRPEPLRHADLARASRRRRGDRRRHSTMSPRRPAADRGAAALGAGADGHIVGRDRRDPLPFADHLRRYRARRRAAIPVDAEADERAVMLVGGEAELDGDPLELFTLYVLAPGPCRAAVERERRAAMLMGGQAFSTRRYVFWNFVSSSRDRINQAKEDWKALRFPLVPGDDQEYIPLPEVPKTVSYPVTESSARVALSTGVTLNVALGRRSGEARR